MSDDRKIGKEAVVLAYIKQFLSTDIDITRETRLVDLIPVSECDARIDPQKAFELQQALEERYGCNYIDPEASDGWMTIKDVITGPVESAGT